MTTKDDRQRAVVAELYAATGKGDWAAAEKLLTEDFVVTEAQTLPMAGRYTGRGAMRELYTRVVGLVSFAGLEVHAVAVGDDHVVAILDMVLEGTGGRVQIAEMFRFRGDKVCEIRPYYYDPTPINEAVAARAKRR